MDKFSNDFSNKSYNDLLDEYAGESLTSKVNGPHEKDAEPTRQNTAKPAESKDIYTKRPAPKVPGKAVIETPKREPAQKSTPPVHKVNSGKPFLNSSSNATHAINLRTIKRFEEEIKLGEEAEKSVSQSKSGDTMEFSKRKLAAKAPVIEKLNNQNTAGKKKKGKNNADSPRKAINKKEAIINALKVNKSIFIGLAVCIAVSVVVSIFLISCVNDVLAIGRDSETSIEVVLPNNADTKTAVSVLKDSGLIKNEFFCNLFIKAMGYSDDNYLPGVYYFTGNMGVEKMIKRFKTSSTRGAIVSITIPEGYTIDQIFERLEKNNVCTASALYKTIDEVDFSKEYDFVPGPDAVDDCYHVLEGFFFPATYEFEQGADPATVVRTFLNAFKQHWTEDYAKKAEELGFSVNDVITLASVIEKEGANTKQFTQISSVLHNRLNKSGLYPLLQCDSTRDYVTNTISERVMSKSELNKYIGNYNTYECEGLPVGAICNPGTAAIEAALNPEINNYYFFAHDKNQNIYMAETQEKHDANLITIAKVNAQ